MFTSLVELSRGLCPCLLPSPESDDEGISSSTTAREQTPLLSTSKNPPKLHHHSMPLPRKTYGSKRTAASQKAADLFGKAANRSPLADLTTRFANVTVKETVPIPGLPETSESPDSSESSESEESIESSDSDDSEESTEDEGEDDKDDEVADDEDENVSSPSPASRLTTHPCLDPLISAYKEDTGRTLVPQQWTSILSSDATVSKIAEASYAEVFRITTPSGTSIIKIMQLQTPTDISSLSIPTAIQISTVVSEIRIMNALTEVPGYVTFKEAHLVQGKPTEAVAEAYEIYNAAPNHYSNFPHPHNFTDNSLFLVLELGDAGTVLEEYEIANLDEIWDIFIGVVMALARAESSNEFEHRDLHENNICVSQKLRSPRKRSPRERDPNLKYGYSSLDITIIDYGLSRATLANEEVVFNDLEFDLAIFHGTGAGISAMQYDCYRRMRTYLLTSSRKTQPKAWHIPLDNPSLETWKPFIPYTNVLWIRFILHYLSKIYYSAIQDELENSHGYDDEAKRKLKDYQDWENEIRELKRRLDTRTKVEKGAFETAGGVLDWLLQVGWVDVADLGLEGSWIGEGTSILGSGNY